MFMRKLMVSRVREVRVYRRIRVIRLSDYVWYLSTEESKDTIIFYFFISK